MKFGGDSFFLFSFLSPLSSTGLWNFEVSRRFLPLEEDVCTLHDFSFSSAVPSPKVEDFFSGVNVRKLFSPPPFRVPSFSPRKRLTFLSKELC